jgi:hypothetical protein
MRCSTWVGSTGGTCDEVSAKTPGGSLHPITVEVDMPIGSLTAKDERMSSITEGSNVFLNVPRYQRGYAWTRDNVDDLLRDMTDVDSGQFFIGTVILHIQQEDSETYNLIDGQQRMTTCTMLLATIRDKLMEIGNTEDALRIHQHISSKPLGGDERYRLKPCAELLENNFFENAVQQKNPIQQRPINKSQKNVVDNIKEFENWVDRELSPGAPEFSRQLVDLAIRLTKSKIILIKVEHAEDAYKIFESVNARGVELSVADLLKNYLLQNLPEQGGHELNWLHAQRVIERIGQGISMPKFVRYSWISRYQFDSEKNMFRGIKAEIKPEHCEDFLEMLNSDAHLLEQILTSAVDIEITPRFHDVNKVLSDLNVLGVKQFLPLAMGLLRNASRLKIEKPHKILRTIERFLFRYNTICNLPSNRVERLFSRISRDLENLEFGNEQELVIERDKVFNKLRRTLSDLNPTTELFIEKFVQVEYKSSSAQKMVIRRIFDVVNSAIGTGELTYETNIEHILPQKPETWGLTRDEIAEYVNNIGNLTMIQKTLNSRMGNKSFDDKFPLLTQSEIRINSNLNDFLVDGNWDQESIDNRSLALAVIVNDSTTSLS